MSNTFHLAVPAGDIPTALKFYKDIFKNNSDLSENFVNIKDLETSN